MKTLFIVEDDRDICGCLRMFLEEEGYQVFCAHDGGEALAVLPTIPRPDIILLDYQMPVKTGVEVYEELRSDDRFKDLPVVFLTASTGFKAPEGAYVLFKPFQVKPLLNMVEELTTRRAEPTVQFRLG